jgi:diphthine-ammonia ligase
MDSAGTTAAEQMEGIVVKLVDVLHSGYETTPSSITSTTILLRRMQDFAAVNPVYGTLFSQANPPSRVTVAFGDLLPQGKDVLLSITFDRVATGKRRGLHVQSRSYWAPANIGPYSQAIAIPLGPTPQDADPSSPVAAPELVHVAGQIPLLPATMKLATRADVPAEPSSAPTPAHEACLQVLLSLQHLWRIGRAMDVTAWTGAVAFIPAPDDTTPTDIAQLALDTWSHLHQHLYRQYTTPEQPPASDDFDVWTRNHRALLPPPPAEKQDSRPPLPHFPSIESESASAPPPTPPCFAVEVAELPRAAPIEWCSYGLARGAVKLDTRPLPLPPAGAAGAGAAAAAATASPITQHSITSIPTGFTVSYFSIPATCTNATALAHALAAIDQASVAGSGTAGPSETGSVPRALVSVYTTCALPREWLVKTKPHLVPCRSIVASEGVGGRLAVLVVVLVGC